MRLNVTAVLLVQLCHVIVYAYIQKGHFHIERLKWMNKN